MRIAGAITAGMFDFYHAAIPKTFASPSDDTTGRRNDGTALFASEIYTLTGGSGDDWEHACRVALPVDPDNPLYQGMGAGRVAGVAATAAAAAAVPLAAPAAWPAWLMLAAGLYLIVRR